MTKLFIVGLLMLTLFMAGAAEQPAIQGRLDQRAEAPTYNRNESWIFKVNRFSYTQSSSDEIRKGGEFVVVPSQKGTEVFRLEGGQQIPVSKPYHLAWTLPTPLWQQNIAKYYDFPLYMGKKWQAPGFQNKITSPDMAVTGIETVTTAAGTFQAYKIERVISRTMPNFNVQRFWFTYYYSPETRSLVKSSYEENTLHCGYMETMEIELVRYGNGKTSPPKSVKKENFVSLPAPPPPVATIELEPTGPAGSSQQQKTIEAKSTQEVNSAKEPPPIVIAAPKIDPAVPATQLDTPWAAAEVKEAIVPKKSASTGGLTLNMNIIGQRKEADGSYSEVIVREAGTLRSYDNFQVHLETNRPAYVYILLYDSQGKANQLFPDPKIDHSGYAQGGKKLILPDTDQWFWLDENTGIETIFVLASEKPMTEIRGLLTKMEKADDVGQQRASQEITKRIAGMQRGIGGVTQGQTVAYQLSDGSKIQKVTEVVSGAGAVVRAVAFRHVDSKAQPGGAGERATTARKTRGPCLGAG